ncbi:MAG TPA: hypothetical protein VGX03_29015 [Candidatus Binatia bacterium]|jgi:hypothetical protein|nr:hypothetical protein [Candidatus Binatia bacterium]
MAAGSIPASCSFTAVGATVDSCKRSGLREVTECNQRIDQILVVLDTGDANAPTQPIAITTLSDSAGIVAQRRGISPR